VIGRWVEIVADLSRVRVLCEGKSVADHDRVWAWHQIVSDPEHVAAAKSLRRSRIGVVRPAPEPEVEQRCLADDDTALGLDGDAEGPGWPDVCNRATSHVSLATSSCAAAISSTIDAVMSLSAAHSNLESRSASASSVRGA
jgi:hypothetical protein